jgi:methane monooxygenase component A beta chain/propane monooxygenase small subunit
MTVTAPTTAAARATGHKTFTWFTPAGRHATDYELYTVGQQSDPKDWLKVDWPLMFDSGRAPFSEEASKIRSSRWRDWRDPFQVWQRPYVQESNYEEQALERMVPGALDGGGLQAMNPAWLGEAVGTYYAAWPYAEYGQFLALCYSVREAFADTVQFSTAFEATDKFRHLQDVVRLLLEIKDRDTAFSDAAARDAWMRDPVLVPTRETVERIFTLNDYVEILVAVNLCFEPLVGRLVKDEFLAHNAPYNGDVVTPMILSAVRRDSSRHLATTKELVLFLLSDPEHGRLNRTVISDWIRNWTASATQAALAAGALFRLPGITLARSGAEALSQVQTDQSALVAGLGL